MADKRDDEAVWTLLGRIRETLYEFLPEDVLSDETQTPEEEVDEIVKGIRMLGQGLADKL
ncbi:MAG: hypothetical protein ACRC67_28445 [Inquilinus sp.]|uniref:hypothetical protein n=1 Tax=Inquilinus sp. TaxID=1932117 RepID=UPI003F36AE3C